MVWTLMSICESSQHSLLDIFSSLSWCTAQEQDQPWNKGSLENHLEESSPQTSDQAEEGMGNQASGNLVKELTSLEGCTGQARAPDQRQ